MKSVWAGFPCSLLKGIQKRDFLEIYLTMVFQIRNFENRPAVRIIFFLKIFKILSSFLRCWKKVEKKFSVLGIIASHLPTSICLFSEVNTPDRQSRDNYYLVHTYFNNLYSQDFNSFKNYRKTPIILIRLELVNAFTYKVQLIIIIIIIIIINKGHTLM